MGCKENRKYGCVFCLEYSGKDLFLNGALVLFLLKSPIATNVETPVKADELYPQGLFFWDGRSAFVRRRNESNFDFDSFLKGFCGYDYD